MVNNMLSRTEIFKKVEMRQMKAVEAYKIIMELEKEKNHSFDHRDLLKSIKETLIDAVADTLKYNKKSISPSIDFREFGFSSFSLAGFKKYIDTEYGIELGSDVFFKSSTINKLAEYLLNTHRDSIVKKYEKDYCGELKYANETPSNEEAENESDPQECDSEKLSPKKMILKEQPVWLLNASKKFPKELLENFWENLRENRTGEIQSERISTDLLSLLMESGYKYMHMLAEISTGEKMEFFLAGKGEAVVVIPGIGATAALTYNQLKSFSPQYRFIVCHVPGSGLSEGMEDLSLDNIAKVVEESLEKLGVKGPVHIFGGSWGAMVAMTFAKNYPGKTASMVLMCPVVDLLDSEETGESSEEHLIKINEISRKDIMSVPKGEKYYELYSKSICADVITLSNYMKYFSSDSPDFYSTVNLIEDIEAPALVVTGSQDSMTGKRHSEILRSKLKNVKFSEIQGAGHFPVLTHSSEFNMIVSKFFKEIKESKK